MRDLEGFLTWLKGLDWQAETVIDAGACYGTPALLSGFPNAYHILIEPVTEREARLQAILQKYRGCYHLCALSDAAGEGLLCVNPEAPAGANLVHGAKTDRDARRVPVRRLDDLLGDHDLARPIILKTDCQGYDLRALKGAIALLKPQDIVIVEANLFHPAGDPTLGDFGEIVAWMRRHDWAVLDILSYQTRPRDGALGYVDLAFGHEKGPFRAAHSWL
jgi:FkbM family methyltransferase